MSQINPLNENGAGEQIAQLKEAVQALDTRVRQLESEIRKDHETLEDDHRRIESLEHTGVIRVKPVGL